ncbi:RHS repeat protein [Faecalibacter rhinopitheci]|uniref:RHS repeat protein n=1 Tax=Faecalibacter rhinopitheci TaxID=2779678 RepID=A0A8J7G491_9FLAO|nr:RHS repeat protein [Faecalibacter rhinopitheci]MBF0596387.1 RHS repeat protein [Faecalibacter rhinopitheci]
MNKKIILLFLLQGLFLEAQDNKLTPEIFPPAPTSNSLMKFEEVPVSYYTGVPDINIPIYNLKSKSLEIPVKLSYHLHNIKPQDRATEVGLGWSLIASGSITRTIKSGPDESNFIPSTQGGKAQIGIYFDEFTNKFIDKNYAATTISQIENGNLGDLSNNPNYGKLMYEAFYFNKFDTQYDLYQYNFFGYSGRFIVKKDSENKFYVEKLDVDNLEIKCNFDSLFVPISFTITDELGRKYIFDVPETTNLTYTTERRGLYNSNTINLSHGTNTKSAFHLSKIYDFNDNVNPIVKFNYNDPIEISFNDVSNITRNRLNYTSNTDEDVARQSEGSLPALKEINITNNTIKIRHLNNIEIPGQGKVIFTYTPGREDTDYGGRNHMYKLESIAKFDNYDNELSKYSFNYDYFRYGNKIKLKLDNIKHLINNQFDNDYVFEYNNSSSLNFGIDKWGWANCATSDLDRNVDINCMKVNSLKSIKLPLGGLEVFDFGPNIYSFNHKGEPVTSLEENIINNGNIQLDKSNITNFKSLFTLDSDQEVKFDVNAYGLDGIPWQIRLYKDGILIDDYIGNIAGDDVYNTSPIFNLKKGIYSAKLQIIQPGFKYNDYINLYSYVKEVKRYDYKIGGGLRINNIKYYNSKEDYLSRKQPSRNISYEYSLPTNENFSSGSLVFPEPFHSYDYSYSARLIYPTSLSHSSLMFNSQFNLISSQNLYPVQKTKGGDVGYKYVKIIETDGNNTNNTINIYTSSLDYPNLFEFDLLPPYLPVGNYDYKRGLNIDNIKKDNYNNTLQKINNQYQYNFEKSKIIGLNILFGRNSEFEYLYASKFDNYNKYIAFCDTEAPNIFCYQKRPEYFLTISEEKEVIGIAQNINTKTTEFLNGLELVNNSITEYNGTNKLLPSKNTTTNSKGETITTEYQYPQDWAANNNVMAQKLVEGNRINEPLKIEKFNNSILLSSTYNEFQEFNGVMQKSRVFQKKGSSSIVEGDDVIAFNSYDSFGNITQYTPKNGSSVSIIWGFNGQYPVAKIEGDTYANSITKIGSLLTKLQNGTLTPSEENSIRGLFPDAMITTYKYKPLIGVTSITGPNGLTEIYEYDSAGRLEVIRNHKNEILKTFKYNYKN